jgi:hypothetical protein
MVEEPITPALIGTVGNEIIFIGLGAVEQLDSDLSIGFPDSAAMASAMDRVAFHMVS